MSVLIILHMIIDIDIKLIAILEYFFYLNQTNKEDYPLTARRKG